MMATLPFAMSSVLRRRLTIDIVVFLALVSFGLACSSYNRYTLVIAGTYALVTLGNNLLLGHLGIMSIGHAGFFAAGSYSFAYLVDKGVSMPVAIAIATVFAGFLGFLLSVPALRLKGHFFSLVTLGFSAAVGEIIISMPGITGGSNGLAVKTGLMSEHTLFLVVAALVGLVLLSQEMLLATRVGATLHLVRDSEVAARSLGVNIVRWRAYVFVYSGALAGLGGSFFAIAIGFLAPESFDVFLSIYFLVAVVIGGMRRPLGAVIGAGVIVEIPQQTLSTPGYSPAILGIALLLAVFVLVWRPSIPTLGLTHVKRAARRNAEIATDRAIGDVK